MVLCVELLLKVDWRNMIKNNSNKRKMIKSNQSDLDFFFIFQVDIYQKPKYYTTM